MGLLDLYIILGRYTNEWCRLLYVKDERIDAVFSKTTVNVSTDSIFL